MNALAPKPVIFLAFANDKTDTGAGYLRGLTRERNSLRDALRPAEDAGLCEVVVEPDASIDRIFNVFQDKRYRDRIAIMHYGGHAESYELLLESASGEGQTAHSEGLVSFLAKQEGLKLVFLNGCSSRKQSEDLIAAGLPAVIGTSRAIDDGVATSLSGRFYKGLAAGNELSRAWAEAADQVRTEKGGAQSRSLMWRRPEDASGDFPWTLLTGPQSAEVTGWSLPVAASQPLFGLDIAKPFLRTLPPEPFPGPRAYLPEEAPVFFGRGEEIRRLYNLLLEEAPVVVLSGKPGIGKTSLLQAGLYPRIQSRFEVGFIPAAGISPEKRLVDCLEHMASALGVGPMQAGNDPALPEKIVALSNALAGASPLIRPLLEAELVRLQAQQGVSWAIPAYWCAVEKAAGKPVVLISDPGPLTDAAESAAWARLLVSIFSSNEEAPLGKILISVREKDAPTLGHQLDDHRVVWKQQHLERLSRQGLMEAVEGLSLFALTRDTYRLGVETAPENHLPSIVADDVLEGGPSLMVPVFQIMLLSMWEHARKEGAQSPVFSVGLYQRLKQSGDLLSGRVAALLTGLRETLPDVLESGLVLDVLNRHTSPVGSPIPVPVASLEKVYAHQPAVFSALLSVLRESYVLSEITAGISTLSHGFLAPVILRTYSNSMRPGQQATRILAGKMEEFRASPKTTWLDDADLAMVERGRAGMRQLTEEEEKLVKISRVKKRERDTYRRQVRQTLVALAGVIAATAVLALWQWRVSERNFRASRSGQLAYIAQEAFPIDPTKALRIASEAYGILGLKSAPMVTQTLSNFFHAQDSLPFYAAAFFHDENVNSAVFSPNGDLVLTASEDGWANLWDLGGNQLEGFKHPYEVFRAGFSPNGKQVITLARDSVRLWETSGKLLHSLPFSPDQYPDLSAFSTDGLRLVPAYRSPDAPVTRLAERLSAEGNRVVISPDQEQLLALSPDGVLSIWDKEGSLIADSLSTHVVGVAFAAYGTAFAAANHPPESPTGEVLIWTMDAQLIYRFEYPGVLENVAISPDGSQLLTASKDQTARLWDLGRMERLSLPHHPDAVTSAAWDPDQSRFVTACYDHMVRIFDMFGYLTDSLQHDGPVTSAVFSPDGSQVLTASADGTARLWQPGLADALRFFHRGEVKAAVFSPGGDQFATASLDSTIRLWSSDGKPLDSLRLSGEAQGLAFSANGQQLLTWTTDSSAVVWFVSQKKSRELRHQAEVHHAAFSPDGRQVVTASGEGWATVWTTDGKMVRELIHPEMVTRAQFSPDGKKIITAGTVVRFWGKGNVPEDSLVHELGVHTLVFSPNQTYLVTASHDQKVRLWKPGKGLMAVYAKHEFSINSVAFSADGSRLLTAGSDGQVRFWFTPEAIHEWMKTGPLYELSEMDREIFGMNP